MHDTSVVSRMFPIRVWFSWIQNQTFHTLLVSCWKLANHIPIHTFVSVSLDSNPHHNSPRGTNGMLADFPFGVFCPVISFITCAIEWRHRSRIHSHIHYSADSVLTSLGSAWYVALPALNTLTCPTFRRVQIIVQTVQLAHTGVFQHTLVSVKSHSVIHHSVRHACLEDKHTSHLSFAVLHTLT